ncbi:signal transduction histidine kinase [Filimonas zeae]|uniref:histidine kinase n=1 Tax=Filimonas zeae TaxID=1737353 RepID=A0A917MY62_9BACT|nr:HAMP domain-containing sensor histidine kinase [Filimonas zeae]MDR6341205.1 signal transduction histidine kinase [Filimonas zeae]GGH76804.1 hypothetical protein GCM10011379_42200 [Filimonas zeae]
MKPIILFLTLILCIVTAGPISAQKQTGELTRLDSLQQTVNRLEQEKEAALAKMQEAERILQNQKALLVLAGVLFILLIVMAIPFYLNYKKVQMFSDALKQKNGIIQKNAASLDQLNRAISRQNQKLEEDNKLKDKLLSVISHDLRHPLVNTKSILDLINLKLVSPQETEELLEQLENQYVRSLSLLDNLLFWIRGQMKGLKIERSDINMFRVITSLIEEQRVSLQAKQIQMINRIDTQLVWKAEKEMLKIIFRNLLTNAIKFTPTGGEIIISSVTDEHYAYILIKDTGIGMTPDILQKINSRQYISSKGTSNEKGSGFGLMLVKDLIIKNDAELLIDSEPGRGTTMAVKFLHAQPVKENA